MNPLRTHFEPIMNPQSMQVTSQSLPFESIWNEICKRLVWSRHKKVTPRTTRKILAVNHILKLFDSNVVQYIFKRKVVGCNLD